MQHLTVPASTAAEPLGGRRRVRRLVRPRLPGHQRVRHGPVRRRGDRACSTRSASTRRSTSTSSCTTRSRASPTAATRATSRARPRSTSRASGVADTAFFGAEAEFYIFDSIRFGSDPHQTFHHIDSVEGWWNTGRDEAGRQPRLQGQLQGRLLPGAAGRPLRRPARRHGHQHDRRWASRSSAATTRWAPRARPRSTTSSTRCCTPPTTYAVQVHHQEHGMAARQDRHLHAEAAVRRQRLGHARPPVAVEGRPAAVPRRVGLRRPVGHGPLLHRRPAAPRAEPAGVHQPHGELLPPPGAGLRGAGQPGLLGAQPLGVHPHPALGQQPEGQAPRVPLPRLARATRTWRSRR